MPNLFVIGAMKASTTTFYDLIRSHPDLWFAEEKEPHYFTSPVFGDSTAWNSYLQLFDAAPHSAEYLGEASTGYSKLPHFGNTPLRIQETLSEANVSPRFIYLIRDPVERTISNYQHSYQMGHYATGTTLGQAIEQDPIVIDASCYARQIRAFREVFGNAALLVIPTNQLHTEPLAVMRQVEAFLGLRAYNSWDVILEHSNSKQALRGSLTARSLLPAPALAILRKLLPTAWSGWLKQFAQKQFASKAPELPPVSSAERELVLGRIADDLRDLVELADEKLAPWVSEWPSVKQLGEG